MAACKGTVLVLICIYLSSSSGTSDQCHCATSSACSGYPDVACTACKPFWSGPTCQIQNIARGDVHSARASDRSDSSDRVVDGEKSGHPDRCTSISDETGTQASWSLILNHTHEIHGMKIYYQSGHRDDLKEFEVRINAALCKKWPENEAIPGVLDITCDRPLTGDLVSISIPLSSVIVKTLALCEVEIFECGDYWYGDNCDNRCNCAVTTEVCDKRDGDCVSGTRTTTLATSTVTPSIEEENGNNLEGQLHPTSTGRSKPEPEYHERDASHHRSVSAGQIAGLIVGSILLLTIAIVAIILVIKMKFVRRPKVTNEPESFYPVSPVHYINRNYEHPPLPPLSSQTSGQDAFVKPTVLPPISPGK